MQFREEAKGGGREGREGGRKGWRGRVERLINVRKRRKETSVMVWFRENLSGLRLKAVSNNGAVARGSNTQKQGEDLWRTTLRSA